MEVPSLFLAPIALDAIHNVYVKDILDLELHGSVLHSPVLLTHTTPLVLLLNILGEVWPIEVPRGGLYHGISWGMLHMQALEGLVPEHRRYHHPGFVQEEDLVPKGL